MVDSGGNMIIRKANLGDTGAVFQLYTEVAKFGGIARTEEEITAGYIQSIYETTAHNGLMLVGFEQVSGNLIAEIHASKYGLKIFDHVLTNLTILVHPNYQGVGVGKQIFNAFLSLVEREWPDIGRVELESRSSNPAAINLYKSLGFVEEGRMKNKTRNKDGSYEDSLLMAWMNPAYKY